MHAKQHTLPQQPFQPTKLVTSSETGMLHFLARRPSGGLRTEVFETPGAQALAP